MKKLIILIILFACCNCGLGPSIPAEFDTKLVVFSTLSNFYDFQFVFVDTVTHIDASEYKEFGMIENLANPVPGIKDAEVIITCNGESKRLTQITESIALDHKAWIFYTQGNYTDHDDKIDIIPGEKYILTVKYKDMEVTSETIIPENFTEITIELSDSLYISWEHSLNIPSYKYEFAKYGYIDIPLYGEYPHYGFYTEMQFSTSNNYLNFDFEDLENEFKNSKYVMYDSNYMTGKYRLRLAAYDKNLYEYADYLKNNIEGGLGIFGSVYIAEKEFEIIEKYGRYEIK